MLSVFGLCFLLHMFCYMFVCCRSVLFNGLLLLWCVCLCFFGIGVFCCLLLAYVSCYMIVVTCFVVAMCC